MSDESKYFPTVVLVHTPHQGAIRREHEGTFDFDVSPEGVLTLSVSESESYEAGIDCVFAAGQWTYVEVVS